MNPLSFDVRRILTWSKRNDPVEFHTCPGLPKYLSWEGTCEGEPTIIIIIVIIIIIIGSLHHAWHWVMSKKYKKQVT